MPAQLPGTQGHKKGHLFARCSLLLSGQEPSRKRFIGELVALPAGPGGALVTLSERRQGTSVPAAGGQAASVAWRAGDSVAHLVHDVAALATLTTSLSPGRFESSIDQTLDWLRQAANAESAELFVVEPRGGDMLLTAYRGPFRKAFEQITCFHPGEGFPGLIQRQASLSLPEASPKTLDTCERR
jgi:hypothetical protein